MKKNTQPYRAHIIYLDNNGTTRICKEAKKSMMSWIDSRANPSSDSIISKKSKEMIDCATDYMLKHCHVSRSTHTAIFTSGASESNSFILRSVVDAYLRGTKKKPHIITSATEHKSIIKCCNHLLEDELANVTFIEPTAYGCIDPELVKKAITANTAIISIMTANNEIGCLNNIRAIGSISHSYKIPFHTDATASFGKYRYNLMSDNIDAISMSFHKLYGPMGIGMIILNNDLIKGYVLKGLISGTQFNSLRGGTENVPAIAGALACMQSTFTKRLEKNKKMYALKLRIISGLNKYIHKGSYKSYFDNATKKRNEFVVLGPTPTLTSVLPNTLLISFAKNVSEPNDNKPFCNVHLKKCLNKKKIIVSIGSACSTSSPEASHVIYAIKAPLVIRQGVIRVSLSDDNTTKEIDIFIKTLIDCVSAQMII
jgi:cysteine desulfurase